MRAWQQSHLLMLELSEEHPVRCGVTNGLLSGAIKISSITHMLRERKWAEARYYNIGHVLLMVSGVHWSPTLHTHMQICVHCSWNIVINGTHVPDSIAQEPLVRPVVSYSEAGCARRPDRSESPVTRVFSQHVRLIISCRFTVNYKRMGTERPPYCKLCQWLLFQDDHKV